MNHEDVLDRATPLEAHAALPVERLRPWLSEVLGEDVGEVEVARFGRGYSNLTFLIRVGERELVLRRPPPGVKIASAHDMAREHRIVEGVGRVWSKVPRTVAVCHDAELLGGAFYLMERLSGVIFRTQPPRGLAVDEAMMAAASSGLVETLAEIHGLDVNAAGLHDLGRPEGYVKRQVEGWTKRYARSQTDEIADVSALAAWLAEHQPSLSRPALIHNDFKYDNVILAPDDLGRVMAVLDWEMATVGDPLMDLGTMLAYWVQADDPAALYAFRLVPTDLAGNLTREELVTRYMAATGIQHMDPVWYYAFGMFKNAVVAQQLYARYRAGLTTEARYARMIEGVRGLAAVARRAIARGRISDLGN